MQGIKETLSEAIEIGFKGANTGIEIEFFCFSEMPPMSRIQKKALHAILMHSFDRLFHLDALLSGLMETVIGTQHCHRTPPSAWTVKS